MSDLFTKIYQDAITRNDDDLKNFLDDFHKKDELIKTLMEQVRIYENKEKRDILVIKLMQGHPEKIKDIYKDWINNVNISEDSYDEEE